MSTAGNVKHQHAREATENLIVQLRTEIHDELTRIVGQARNLRAIAGSRHNAGLGFITPETQASIDETVRADRAAVRTLPDRDLGLDFLNATAILGSGATRSPIAPAVMSADAEILFGLQEHVRRLGRAAVSAALLRLDAVTATDASAGFCALPKSPAYSNPLLVDVPLSTGDVGNLAERLGRLVDVYTNRPALQTLLRDLRRLADSTDNVLQGPARTPHPKPCPWCGRRSLVIVHRDQHGQRPELIVCERLDHEHACECDDPRCSCHVANGGNPFTNRHEWRRGDRHGNTWRQLDHLIDQAEETARMETRARDALEQIRALHQPTYIHAGKERRHYVLVHWDNAPDGHECITNGFDACIPDDAHSVPACVECRSLTADGEDGFALWPCPTYLAANLDEPSQSGAAR